MKFALLFAVSLPLLAVDGTVLNSSIGRPQSGVEITLVQPGQNGMTELGRTTSDAQGHFNIDKQIPPGPGLLQAVYQGVTYNQIITPGMPVSGVEIKVYEATSKKGTAKSAEHLILLEPSTSEITITETFVFSNDSNTTFNDPKAGSAQFFLPPGAEEKSQVVVSAPGGMPIARPALKTSQAGIYKVDYPLKPGDTRFDVHYTVPASKTFAGKVVAGEGATHLVTPSAVTLTGDGIESAGQEPQTQAHIYNLTGLDYKVLVDGTGSLRAADSNQNGGEDDSGSPKIEIAQARIYGRLYWVLGLTLGVLALGGLLLYRRGTA